MHLVTEKGLGMAEADTETQGLAGWIVGAARRWKARGWSDGRPKRQHMRVVETITIGVKKQLVLVSCDGERFLVGTGAESVGTIVRVRPESGVTSREDVAR